ncbi:hypothetical protein EK904_015088, partial [Melospiza melodia maxima]
LAPDKKLLSRTETTPKTTTLFGTVLCDFYHEVDEGRIKKMKATGFNRTAVSSRHSGDINTPGHLIAEPSPLLLMQTRSGKIHCKRAWSTSSCCVQDIGKV